MTEVPLGGGRSVDGIVRVGDTVRRPPQFATQLMRDVLVFLEQIGFAAAPRWLGIDERGRDVLSFLDGDTFSDCGAIVWSDDQLAASAQLLRRYHDAVAGSSLANGRETVCHGDYGPWNLIWRGGLPAAIIDFDNARPGARADDVGYALWKHLNPGLVPLGPAEQERRGRLFVAAYGAKFDVVDAIAAAQEQAAARFARHGWDLTALDRERAWLASSRAGFAREQRARS